MERSQKKSRKDDDDFDRILFAYSHLNDFDSSSLKTKILECLKSDMVYFDEKCNECYKLPIETLQKIALHLGNPLEVENNWSKETLCTYITYKIGLRFRFDTFKDPTLEFEKKFMPDFEVLEKLKKTELFVTAYSSKRKKWEKKLEDIYLASAPFVAPFLNLGRIYADSKDFGKLVIFEKWRIKRDFLATVLSLKKSKPLMPKELVKIIAFQNLLKDCDSPKSIRIELRESRTNDVKKLFKNEGVSFDDETKTQWFNMKLGYFKKTQNPNINVFLYHFPSLRVYCLAEMLGVLEPIPGTKLFYSQDYHCKKIMQLVHILEPDEVKSLIQQDIERELEKQKNKEMKK